MRRAASSLAITDPLVRYQSLVATGLCCPDPAQHRLALHLHKVYLRLKDYTPSVEYGARLRAISTALDPSSSTERAGGGGGGDDERSSSPLAAAGHPILRNPLFARFFARSSGSRGRRDEALALTRVLTGHEEAIHIDSPRGLFLSGEVGTGKSMLLDLLADGLPTGRKRRWHFSTFMLHVLSQLERHRKMHAEQQQQLRGEGNLGGGSGGGVGGGGDDHQLYSLAWMARDMVDKSPILFLDEFQLPDKAASKILSSLFTAFFQLGGVLVASSNRMPEELEKATGSQPGYVVPSAGGVVGRALGLGRVRGRGELFGSSSDFAAFLEVLKARCEFWQMEGARDWRRNEADQSATAADKKVALSREAAGTEPREQGAEEKQEMEEAASNPGRPRNYFISGNADEAQWTEAMDGFARRSSRGGFPWRSSTLTVYGRVITVPEQDGGVVRWDFGELVSSFGPADYITMASTFHTFIVDGVPVLPVARKNEARRLITLLDALYEARCRLVVRAAAGPDDLFFPEASSSSSSSSGSSSSSSSSHNEDAIHSETIAEAYQDRTSPFRLNISAYGESSAAGVPSYDEDNPSSSSAAGSVVDFRDTGAFTGEDERFAYRRAASRLWEMCGARWHARGGGEEEGEGEDGGSGWWRPLPPEARHWEGGPPSVPPVWEGVGRRSGGGAGAGAGAGGGDARMGPSVELEEPAGLSRLGIEFWRKTVGGKGGGKQSG
ncbi:AFG1-like ATPase-domain-containing protein [Xylariaceae sp. FL0804]|nr:AFG1-like ATPase-domain-containing protein [Xylariaceae sp. FL0804]